MSIGFPNRPMTVVTPFAAGGGTTNADGWPTCCAAWVHPL